jgi:hypothetical protein
VTAVADPKEPSPAPAGASPSPGDLLNAKEAALVLGVSRNRLYDDLFAAAGGTKRAGGEVVFERWKVESLRDERARAVHKQGPTPRAREQRREEADKRAAARAAAQLEEREKRATAKRQAASEARQRRAKVRRRGRERPSRPPPPTVTTSTRPAIARDVTGEVAAQIVEALRSSKSPVDVVVEMKLLPAVVMAVEADYRKMVGALTLSPALLERVYRLPHQGVTPCATPEEFVELLEVSVCAAAGMCKKCMARGATHCAGCRSR